MKELLLKRLALIKVPEIREWGHRMIREWSQNDATSMTIVQLAEYHADLFEMREQTANVSQFILNGKGELVRNPIYAAIDKMTGLVRALSRDLNVSPDAVFDEEGYE